MKKVLTFAMFVLACSMVLPAPAQLIMDQYPNESTSKQIPDFSKALVAINFSGPNVRKAADVFHSQGRAMNILRSVNPLQKSPCDIPYSVICVSMVVQDVGTESGGGGFAGSGSHGGYSAQSSFSGDRWVAAITVDLIVRNEAGDVVNDFPLATSKEDMLVGMGSEWSSNYSRGSSGYVNFTGTSTPDMVIPKLISNDLGRLFIPGFKHCMPILTAFSDKCMAWSEWTAGSADAVAATAFPTAGEVHDLVDPQPQPVPTLVVRQPFIETEAPALNEKIIPSYRK